VDLFVTPSRYARGQLGRLGLAPERVEVVANYVPEAGFADRSAAHEGRYAVAAGRLSAEKGFATAVEAAASAGIPLKIAGDGPLEAELRAQAAALGAPVELLGRVPEAEMPALLRGAALAVVPSVGGDVMPFAALEAMAAGVPVIASRSGSLPELVGEERCVPRRDPPSLAAAMRALWDAPDRRRAEGDALIARARERFGEERYVEGLLALYAGMHAHA
jgi:glycosyltransferase involved in cell wall biosynthesis